MCWAGRKASAASGTRLGHETLRRSGGDGSGKQVRTDGFPPIRHPRSQSHSGLKSLDLQGLRCLKPSKPRPPDDVATRQHRRALCGGRASDSRRGQVRPLSRRHRRHRPCSRQAAGPRLLGQERPDGLPSASGGAENNRFCDSRGAASGLRGRRRAGCGPSTRSGPGRSSVSSTESRRRSVIAFKRPIPDSHGVSNRTASSAEPAGARQGGDVRTAGRAARCSRHRWGRSRQAR